MFDDYEGGLGGSQMGSPLGGRTGMDMGMLARIKQFLDMSGGMPREFGPGSGITAPPETGAPPMRPPMMPPEPGMEMPGAMPRPGMRPGSGRPMPMGPMAPGARTMPQGQNRLEAMGGPRMQPNRMNFNFRPRSGGRPGPGRF